MKNKQAVSTGSINFRITASSCVGLLACFALLDIIIVLLFMQDPALLLSPGGMRDARETLRGAFSDYRFIIIIALESVMVAMKAVLGSQSVRHKLEPVERISRMAIELGSAESTFDEEKFRKLEEAIDRISPESGDAGLSTGDKELVGLELAVNGLIERMKESYDQQARFVSDASHELRTPIAVIKGYADMLERWGKKDEKVLEEAVSAIRTESENMSRLVEQLLFLARGDSGRTRFEPEDFDLCGMLSEVCSQSAMIDSSHEYVFRSQGAVTVLGDISLLKQAARILTDNAAKYTPEGGKISLSAGSSGKEVFFSVQDSGIGIAASDLSHLFERFYRADSSRARKTGGSGLGLSIAKWICDRHGGRIEVVSAEDIGTRVTVYLPAKQDS